MDPDEIYTPIFCPCCGYNLNQPGDDDAPPSKEKVPCGWCGQQHSYEQIKKCRKLARISETTVFEGTKHGLLELRRRAAS